MVSTLGFSPDGRYLAVGGPDRTVVHDMKAGKRVGTPITHDGLTMRAVAFSPGGTLLACGGGKVVSLWSMKSGKPERVIRKVFDSPVASIAWVPGGVVIAVGGDDGKVRRWDAAANKFLPEIGPLGAPIYSLEVSPDGKTAWGTGMKLPKEPGVRPFVVSLAERRALYIRVERPNEAELNVALSPDGKTLAMTCGDDPRVAFQSVDGLKGTPLKYLGDGSPVQGAIGWHEDGGIIAWGRFRFSDFAFSPADAEPANAPKDGFPSAAQKRRAGGRALTIIDAETATFGDARIEMPSYLDRIRAGVALPGKKGAGRVALAAGDTVRLFDGATGRPLRDLEGGDTLFTDLAGSPDGEYIAAISADGVVRIWPSDGPDAETFGGIGLYTTTKDRKEVVTGVVEGGPSDGKFRKGDVLLSATSRGRRTDFAGLSPAQVTRAIRGEVGTGVTIRVARTGEKGPVEVALVRRRITGAVPVARPLLSVYFRQGEWVAWTEEGYYACSSGGERLVLWQVEGAIDELPRVYRAEQFRATFYRPDVIRRVLKAGSVLAALKAADEAGGGKTPDRTADIARSQPPVIDLKVERDGTRWVARAEVRRHSDHPVGEVILLIDGAPSGGTPRRAGSGRVIEMEWELRPLPGTHTLQVVTRGEVAATSGKPVVVSQPGKAVKGKLHIGVIWVGEQKNAGFKKIDAPAEIAQTLVKTLRQRSKAFYEEGEELTLVNKEATRKGIHGMFRVLQRFARDGDVTIIHFVGHTKLEGKWLYLVPYDAKPAELLDTAIRYTHFLDQADEIRARRVLVVDSCHAGRLEAGSSLEELIKRRQKPGSGMTVLYSCGATQEAIAVNRKLEDDHIRGPLFTHYWIKGLSGEAKEDGLVGAVTLNELHAYARDKVRWASKTVFKAKDPQTPGCEGQELLDLQLVAGKRKGGK
jgi:hypothetical protein